MCRMIIHVIGSERKRQPYSKAHIGYAGAALRPAGRMPIFRASRPYDCIWSIIAHGARYC